MQLTSADLEREVTQRMREFSRGKKFTNRGE